jgi:hypothetical protein
LSDGFGPRFPDLRDCREIRSINDLATIACPRPRRATLALALVAVDQGFVEENIAFDFGEAEPPNMVHGIEEISLLSLSPVEESCSLRAGQSGRAGKTELSQ